MMNPGEVKKKAPDGGWGWFVCLGSSLISLSLRSLDPSFGLLFHDPLEELEVDSTGTSLIMSILDAIVNFSGLLIGPLLKKYSYRQVAFFGSVLSCTGLILTSRANSMIHIVCTYSILGGLGTGLAIASAFVALNTFFDKKRGQAVGFSMAGTTLAMMLVPQLIHILLSAYGFRGAMLVIGGWALHSAVGACLLRPLDVRDAKDIKTDIDPPESETLLKKNGDTTLKKMENGVEVTKYDVIKNKTSKEISKPKDNYMEKIKETFDLDLLKDGVYLNVVIGSSLYYVAESNFKLMTPFFLSSIVMAEQSKGITLIIIFVVIGFLRGATLVNLNLSVSECCSLKKLPSAFGIFMVSKGLFVVMMSPMIGYIRDVSESYAVCIHVMTSMIMVTFISWGFEFVYRSLKNRKSILSDKAKKEEVE
ncbi:monocarboxylate transporter 2 isoform X2 [Megachile rotundata]|uniref:monocarboxylate transporter 2 isoform X2 n=1 Tax=Megachile rotundata TaxID=143995 RepID=UPI003FD4D9B5